MGWFVYNRYSACLSSPSCATWTRGRLGAQAVGVGGSEQLLSSEDTETSPVGRISLISEERAPYPNMQAIGNLSQVGFPNTFVHEQEIDIWETKSRLNYHRVGMLQRKFKSYCQPTNQTDILSLDFVFSN